MRKLFVVSLTLILVFSLVFSVSATTGITEYEFGPLMTLDLYYHQDTDIQYTYGFDTIYDAYIARRGSSAHLHYILVKGTAGADDSQGYLLYSFMNTDDKGLPLYYNDGFIYTRGNTLIYLYEYVGHSTWFSNASWQFVAESFVDANSYCMPSGQVLWTSDDLYTQDNFKAVTGDHYWNEGVMKPDSGDDDEWEEEDDSVIGFIKKIVNSILSLPKAIADLILNGIKAIFIPDMDEMAVEFESFVNRLSPNTYADADTLGGIGGASSKEPVNAIANISLGNSVISGLNFRTTLVDYGWLKTGVEYFRPVINGLLAWLLGMFYYRELLSFIGQAPNMAQARATAGEHKAEQDKASKNKG